MILKIFIIYFITMGVINVGIGYFQLNCVGLTSELSKMITGFVWDTGADRKFVERIVYVTLFVAGWVELPCEFVSATINYLKGGKNEG